MSTTKNVTLPDIGDFDQVEVIEVLVSIGDIVKENDSIITLENDKATMEIPAPFSGKIKSIEVKIGEKITRGDLIATFESTETNHGEETQPSAEQIEPDAESSAKKDSKPKAADDVEVVDKTISVETSPESHASPSIRKLARELGVTLSNIKGSGQKGRILGSDLKNYVKQIVTGSGPIEGDVEVVPLSRIKKLSGKHLAKCWSEIPHVTQFDEVNIEQMEEFRAHQKARDIKLSPLVFIMKAVVQVLKQHPHFNASLDESGENLLVKQYHNLGIAMDTPDGLIVPVIRDVGKKSLIELADELAEISTRARESGLNKAEMQGAGFTISSLGGIGGTQFTPIINSPEVAILGVSRAQIKPVWNGNEFVPTATLPLALSYDHRVIDGVQGAKFMADLNQVLKNIMEILL
ncbi:MAG TPA: branched-chain alpha-keto acid dehydrogenase subunit E2 [Candidatus Thioglobus sp.]|jgi:pyruvate dehydrogenase E2 component (dihydrolipoamide acetyltransferase)|nr:branched-chain alpha-keto acid dehydrogenase subunit E2 [Candidatus Thioglobus sp.]